MTTNVPASSPSRRTFLQTSAAAAAAGSVLTAAFNPPAVHAAGDDTLKVALIGCGGRGTGAAVNATVSYTHLTLPTILLV